MNLRQKKTVPLHACGGMIGDSYVIMSWLLNKSDTWVLNAWAVASYRLFNTKSYFPHSHKVRKCDHDSKVSYTN